MEIIIKRKAVIRKAKSLKEDEAKIGIAGKTKERI
jgi:hypothetical protein